MASQTREQLQARLDAYLSAELRILQSQDYTIGDGSTARRNKRAELEQVRAEITHLRAEIDQLDAQSGRNRRVMRFVPRF
jgi:hypothetical protein